MAWSRILTTEAETIREVSAAYWKRKREEEERENEIRRNYKD